MKPVRLEILIDDKTLQGLNSVKGNLGATEQLYKQIIGQLKKELSELQQRMKKTMAEGINTDKQAAEIQALTGVVNQLNDELEKLTQAKKRNNATPIIGDDPAPKMNNIKMSMAQIARELPSIAMGPQMFFLAISNNLPVLQDALASARNEFKTLTAAGKEATPVWKQVAKSIVSPQALIAVGITLLVTYGDEIVNFIKKVFKVNDSMDAMAEATERLNKALAKGLKDSAKEVTEMELLYKASQDSTRSIRERKSAVEELQNKYPSYFGNMDKEAVLAGKAASAYDKLKAALVAQAQARAIQDELTELTSKKMEAEEKAAKAKAVQEENAIVSNFGKKRYSVSTFGTRQLTEESKAYNQATEDLAAYNVEIEKYDKQINKLVSKVDVNSLINDPGDKPDMPDEKSINYATELAEARIKAQRKLENMVIETMADGFKKRQALAAQQLKEEISRINADEKAQLDTIKKARAAGHQVDGNAERQVQETANQQRALANQKYLQNTEQIEKEWQEKSLQSWIAYYEKDGTYAQQRVAIIQKYALMINNTTDENEKALFNKQQEEALQSLDEKFGKSVKQMTDLFEDASKKSVSAIEDIISKYEKLVDYMTDSDSNVTKEDLLAVGFTDKDLENLENGTIKIADITKALKELKGELKGKSPFKTFSTDIKDAFEKIKNAKGDTKTIGEGIDNIGEAVTSFTPALKQFGSSIATIFGFDDEKIQGVIGAVDGLGQTAAGIGQAMSGDIVGGIMGAVNGVASVFGNLNTLFGADFSGYEKMKEQYEVLNDIWDQLIEKKQEYISISYGDEANKAGQEALDIVNKSIESYRLLGKERLKSGAGLFSHSIGHDQRERMGRQEWNEVKQAIGKIGYEKITGDRMFGLFDLTMEQLEKLKSEAPTFWAKLDDDVREYLDNIIEGSERLEDIQEQIKEQLTQTTFENVRDSFWNTLLDMESDVESFSEGLSKSMQKAILKANLGELLDKDLRNWYDKFAKANEDGSIDMKEYESLQSEYNSIVEKGLKERNQLMELFGWKLNENASAAQSGRSGTVTTVTEETAGRLEGIGNAQLDRIISIDTNMESMSDNLSAMSSSMATVAENSEYLKRLDDIADNIQNMSSTGVKIKN